MRDIGRVLLVAVTAMFLGLGSAGAQTPEVAPPNLSGYSSSLGVLTFTLTGTTSGAVYGDGIYTDDSDLASAAVHAGVLKAGETGVVSVELLGAQQSFAATTRNGITSQAYGSWGASYRFVDETAPGTRQTALNLPGAPVADPGNLLAFPAEPGTLVSFNIVGAADGTVYGDAIYTGDTAIARAAVHAGLVAPGQSAVVTIMVLGPQASFTASERNGVISLPWDSFDRAYKFVELRGN